MRGMIVLFITNKVQREFNKHNGHLLKVENNEIRCLDCGVSIVTFKEPMIESTHEIIKNGLLHEIIKRNIIFKGKNNPLKAIFNYFSPKGNNLDKDVEERISKLSEARLDEINSSLEKDVIEIIKKYYKHKW